MKNITCIFNKTVLFSLTITVFSLMILATIPKSSSPMVEVPRQPDTVAASTQIGPSQGPVKIFLPALVISHLNPKKGLGVTTPPACSDLTNLKASWYFNWTVWPDSCKTPDARFVPRIYNGGHMVEPYFSQAIENAKVSGWLMGFNEPNLIWQGGVSPEDGARYWKQIEDTALPLGIKLVSPAPNQWEPYHDPTRPEPHGNQWTWAMVKAYQEQNNGQKPHFDALGWNIYNNNHADTKTFLAARRNEARYEYYYNVPFWIIEYGGNCPDKTYTGNEVIMEETTAWFNETDWIERYAWYANRLEGSEDPDAQDYSSCSLIDPDSGQTTDLGKRYSKF